MKKILFTLVFGVIIAHFQFVSAQQVFYRLQGKIGAEDAEMYLQQHDTLLYGHYYIYNSGSPFRVSGTLHGEQFDLAGYAYTNQDDAFVISGKWGKKSFTGNWSTGRTGDQPIGVSFSVVKNGALPGVEYWVRQATSKFPGNTRTLNVLFSQAIINLKGKTTAIAAINNDIHFLSYGNKNFETDKNVSFEKANQAFAASLAAEKTLDTDWEYDLQWSVVYMDANIISLKKHTYEYTGGIHGMYGSELISYNLNTGEKITLDQYITSPEMEAKVVTLLDAQLRKNLAIEPGKVFMDAGLFIDFIYPSRNFLVTSTGLLFCYLPYEIGPWSIGQTMLFVRFDEIK